MTADPVGGVWTFALELCARLVQRGVGVTLATLGAPLTSAQRSAAARLPGLRLEESAFRLEWMAEPWADLEQAGYWLLRLEREHRPDVIHLNHLVHGDLPWRAPVLVTGHSCVASWWQAVHGAALPVEWTTYKLRVRRSLQAATFVSAPTRDMLTQLCRYYGPLPRAVVVPNGRDPACFSRHRRKEHLVLSAGRLWDAAKNAQALGTVAPLLDWPVCVAGESASPDGSRTEVAGTNLHLLGRLAPHELASWYARAAIYALPARYEPFGLTALEAALSGCALLLGDIPSLREVWGDAACYVAPDDHACLRKRLSELIWNGAARTELAGRAADVAARLSPESMAQGYLRIYRKLTGQPARSDMTHAARA
jgi:glycosyltransferase involved in cell wall biosynthesis